MPKISIIIPTYNRFHIIKPTIESVLLQSYKDWECIVVDDNSTDNTKMLIDQYINRDRRFSYLLNNHKKGAPGARNTGILAARGEFVVLFDSDNIMHPTFLEKVYNAVIKNNVDICSCFSRVLDVNTGNVIGHFDWTGYGKVHSILMRGETYFDNSSTLIRKQKLLDIGLLDENCPSYQEWETHIRLSNCSLYNTVEEELVDYYRGGDDTISKSLSRAIRGNLYILNKFRREFSLSYPFYLLKRSFGIYCMIDKEKDEGREYKSLLILFSQSIAFLYQLGVKILFLYKPLVRRIKGRTG